MTNLSHLTAQEREDYTFHRAQANSPVPQIHEFHERQADRILEVATLRQDALIAQQDAVAKTRTVELLLAERDALKAERDRWRRDWQVATRGMFGLRLWTHGDEERGILTFRFDAGEHHYAHAITKEDCQIGRSQARLLGYVLQKVGYQFQKVGERVDEEAK